MQVQAHRSYYCMLCIEWATSWRRRLIHPKKSFGSAGFFYAPLCGSPPPSLSSSISIGQKIYCSRSNWADHLLLSNLKKHVMSPVNTAATSLVCNDYYSYPESMIRLMAGWKELGITTSSLMTEFTIVLVVKHHCTNQPPSLTLVVAGLLSTRVSLGPLFARQTQMVGELKSPVQLAVDT